MFIRSDGLGWGRQPSLFSLAVVGAALLVGAYFGSPLAVTAARTNAAAIVAARAVYGSTRSPHQLTPRVPFDDVSPSAMRLAGVADLAAGEPRTALPLLAAAAAAEPRLTIGRFWLARARELVGDNPIDDYRQADALAYLLTSSLRAWARADCVESTRQALLARSAFPSSADAAYFAGQGLECQGKPKDAGSLYQRTATLAGSQSWLGLVATGDVARLRGRLDEAAATYQQATGPAWSGRMRWLSGGLPYARLVEIDRARGMTAQASTVAAAGLRLYPNDSWLQRQFDTLRAATRNGNTP